MTTQARKTRRAATNRKQTTGRGRTQKAKQAEPNAEQRLLFEKRAIGIDHMQALEAQRAQLEAQKQRIQEQIEEVKDRLSQAVGRVQTFDELLGNVEPLPPLSQVGLPAASENGNGAEGGADGKKNEGKKD